MLLKSQGVFDFIQIMICNHKLFPNNLDIDIQWIFEPLFVLNTLNNLIQSVENCQCTWRERRLMGMKAIQKPQINIRVVGSTDKCDRHLISYYGRYNCGAVAFSVIIV